MAFIKLKQAIGSNILEINANVKKISPDDSIKEMDPILN